MAQKLTPAQLQIQTLSGKFAFVKELPCDELTANVIQAPGSDWKKCAGGNVRGSFWYRDASDQPNLWVYIKAKSAQKNSDATKRRRRERSGAIMKKPHEHTGEGGSTNAPKRGGNAGVRDDTSPSDVEMSDGSDGKGEERTVGGEPGSATAFPDASAPNKAATSDLSAQLRALTMGNSGFETSAAAGSVPPSSQPFTSSLPRYPPSDDSSRP